MQNFTQYEVWIIDGASTDGTVEFLNTLSSPMNWISEKDNGVYEAMNKGIDRSRGEWLYFLGSDDEVFELNTFSKVFKRSYDDIDLIVGNIKYKSSNRIPLLSGIDKTIQKPYWSYSLWLKNCIHHQATFYRRAVFSNFRYSTKYKVLSDYELNIILFKRRVKCYIIDEVIALCGVDGISKKIDWSLYKEEIDIKTNHSTVILRPIIFLNSFFKFLLKKIMRFI